MLYIQLESLCKKVGQYWRECYLEGGQPPGNYLAILSGEAIIALWPVMHPIASKWCGKVQKVAVNNSSVHCIALQCSGWSCVELGSSFVPRWLRVGELPRQLGDRERDHNHSRALHYQWLEVQKVALS